MIALEIFISIGLITTVVVLPLFLINTLIK